jgi:hypothetical protein
MTCLRENNRGSELLVGYLEGTLPEAERRELDSHAAECTECRGLLAVQAELDVPAPAVSADFDAKLYARIAADRPWWSLLGSWKLAAPVVAVAAVLAVTVWIRQPAPQVNPVNVDPVVAQDVQQLEQALDDLALLMPLESI